MFNQNQNRVGFACKIVDDSANNITRLNQSSTTIAWLTKQSLDKAYERLWALSSRNCDVLYLQLEHIAKLPNNQRMFRITSDMLPAYTYETYAEFYQRQDVQDLLAAKLGRCGDFARANDIRLSFHPGQFCVLASENPGVVENSVYEFEYHCDLIRYMGYGKQFQDFKCNVHIGGKLGPEGIKAAITKYLSPEARNCITIENAEFTWGLEHSLELEKHCALVMDIHHHWINSRGEYISLSDSRVQRVIDSWRGVRPTMHYSVSRETVLPNHSTEVLPDYKALQMTSTTLRAHSDNMWNKAANIWAASFSPSFDIMCEAKNKNLASKTLAEFI